MKDYLKMSDVFQDKANHEHEGNFITIGKSKIADFGFHAALCSYAAHAINSHDELVQMNQELLAALEAIDDCYTDTSRDYLTKSELLHHKAVRADVASIIEKAKGGADEASDWLEKELKETANLVK